MMAGEKTITYVFGLALAALGGGGDVAGSLSSLLLFSLSCTLDRMRQDVWRFEIDIGAKSRAESGD
jgi:hypothetical protein